MSTTPPQAPPTRSHRRWAILIAVVLVFVLIAVGLVAVYLFFFGTPAPEAPTLDSALDVLHPSASPE